MNFNYQIILALLANLTIQACALPTLSENGKPSILAPKALFLKNLPQDEEPYSIGFRDGCYNMIGQTGFGFQRLFDKAPDARDDLFMDKFYQLGYTDGDRYCSVYVNQDIIL